MELSDKYLLNQSAPVTILQLVCLWTTNPFKYKALVSKFSHMYQVSPALPLAPSQTPSALDDNASALIRA